MQMFNFVVFWDSAIQCHWNLYIKLCGSPWSTILPWLHRLLCCGERWWNNRLKILNALRLQSRVDRSNDHALILKSCISRKPRLPDHILLHSLHWFTSFFCAINKGWRPHSAYLDSISRVINQVGLYRRGFEILKLRNLFNGRPTWQIFSHIC